MDGLDGLDPTQKASPIRASSDAKKDVFCTLSRGAAESPDSPEAPDSSDSFALLFTVV